MSRSHANLTRRALLVGAGAGVVLELALTGGFLFSRWLPNFGLEPTVHRTLELLPFVLVGGAALLVGAGAFVFALWRAWSGADAAPEPNETRSRAPGEHSRRGATRRRLGPQHRIR